MQFLPSSWFSSLGRAGIKAGYDCTTAPPISLPPQYYNIFYSVTMSAAHCAKPNVDGVG